MKRVHLLEQLLATVAQTVSVNCPLEELMDMHFPQIVVPFEDVPGVRLMPL